MKNKRSQEQWNFADEMEQFIGFLNDGQWRVVRIKEDVRQELISLVEEWLDAKANWKRFLESRIRAGKSTAFCKGSFYIPGQAKYPIAIPMGADGCSEAEAFFQRFILNPECLRLGGRCQREDCRRFFLLKTAHRKLYCSQRCAARAVSLEIMQKARKSESARRIGFAKKALHEWKQQRVGVDWKVWVAAQMADEGITITPKSLTNWVRDGKLKGP